MAGHAFTDSGGQPTTTNSADAGESLLNTLVSRSPALLRLRNRLRQGPDLERLDVDAFGPCASLQAKQFNIRGFIRSSMLDWPGKISSVIFLGGCNFRCPVCHNHRLTFDSDSTSAIPIDEVIEYLGRRRAWIDGITVSGGEPTVNPELGSLLALFKERGISTRLDTNGSNPRMLEDLIRCGLLDAAAMDVKAPLTADEYARVAGVTIDPSVIAESIGALKASSIEVTFRTTVIPGLVEEPELARIAKLLGKAVHYKIQPFRNVETLDPSFTSVKPFPPEKLSTMRRLFETPCAAEPLVSLSHAFAG
jgi:pyruvate formate lyase activating enzyme